MVDIGNIRLVCLLLNLTISSNWDFLQREIHIEVIEMSTLTKADKTFLVQFARSVIEEALEAGSRLATPEHSSDAIFDKRGCFVTLHKKGNLRGCIGTIEPEHALIQGIEENARNSAFRDPRFPPLKKDELAAIKVEVSVLTVPQELSFSDAEDLKAKLKPGVHGVILSRGWQRSTFLPQVWDQLPDKETFLNHLCQKAGLAKHCWQDPETVVEVYQAEYFSE